MKNNIFFYQNSKQCFLRYGRWKKKRCISPPRRLLRSGALFPTSFFAKNPNLRSKWSKTMNKNKDFRKKNIKTKNFKKSKNPQTPKIRRCTFFSSINRIAYRFLTLCLSFLSFFSSLGGPTKSLGSSKGLIITVFSIINCLLN